MSRINVESLWFKSQLISFPVGTDSFYLCMQSYSLKIWSSHRITCDCVTLAVWLYHSLIHAIAINGVEGGIHSDFGTSEIVLVWCPNYNILVQGYSILILVSINLRAVSLVCNLLKMCRVLMMYSNTLLSGIMVISKIYIHKLAFFPVLLMIF